MQEERKIVAHIRGTFYKMSENWIYTQIKYLNDWTALVLANKTENLKYIDNKLEIFARHEDLSKVSRYVDSGFNSIFKFFPSHYIQSKKNRVSLIHAHFGNTGFHALKLAKLLRVPLITTFYGVDISLVPKKNPEWLVKYKKLFEEGDLFLAEGPAMKQQLIEKGCPIDKVKIQHLGVETKDFESRNTYSNDNELKILMAGRFVEKKGFIYGLKAFSKFIKNGGHATLTIIGDSVSTARSEETATNLKNYVKEYNLQEVVSFRGMIPLKELRSAYYEHDVFLSPSVQAGDGDNEGGAPVSIIEASATGMPIISSFHCDIPEVIKHKETGFLCNEKDINAIADYLKVFQDNRNMIKTMGTRTATHIREHYNAKKQGERLSKIYNSTLNN